MIDKEFQYNGFYRATVVEVDVDGNDYGAIRIHIPDLQHDMDPDYDSSKGILSYPANSPSGGFNEETSDADYQASVYIPRKGAWVWIFFEQGNPNIPWYFATFQGKQAKLPPENRGVSEPHKVATVYKSGAGRSIVVCDSEDQQRVEITGKKRQLSGGPSGEGAVYEIEGNQTTILLDERGGKEKVLVQTHKGDYIQLSVDERKLDMSFQGDINIETMSNMNINIGGNLIVKAASVAITSSGGSSIGSGGDLKLSQAGKVHVRAGSDIAIDGSKVYVQSGIAQSQQLANPESPTGGRDT